MQVAAAAVAAGPGSGGGPAVGVAQSGDGPAREQEARPAAAVRRYSIPTRAQHLAPHSVRTWPRPGPGTRASQPGQPSRAPSLARPLRSRPVTSPPVQPLSVLFGCNSAPGPPLGPCQRNPHAPRRPLHLLRPPAPSPRPSVPGHLPLPEPPTRRSSGRSSAAAGRTEDASAAHPPPTTAPRPHGRRRKSPHTAGRPPHSSRATRERPAGRLGRPERGEQAPTAGGPGAHPIAPARACTAPTRSSRVRPNLKRGQQGVQLGVRGVHAPPRPPTHSSTAPRTRPGATGRPERGQQGAYSWRARGTPIMGARGTPCRSLCFLHSAASRACSSAYAASTRRRIASSTHSAAASHRPAPAMICRGSRGKRVGVFRPCGVKG